MLLCTTICTIIIYSIINNFNNDKVISNTLIAERLSKISELSTLKYSYSNIVAITDIKKFKNFYIPFTEKSFLIKYSGYIKGGVDLKDLDILINKKSITITLKKSKILDHVINNEDFFVYDEKSSMFNKLSIQDMINEITSQKNKIEADLIKTGFLDGANANAKLLLEGILRDMGFESVTIIFK
ncbi:DUF4230 domain-containing protein [Clostridium sp. CF012]|uniref:DUF4230 domain-containing protein n=1 Tax=Clostridium sp. CF012 TaxID=2843319 RepID=UPI001C0E8948|nr:DUF4230 domain-containing protein [Clostridium sp. CF012]MBU3143072.1 DUF4230 domain-containing protein [Clostridium sp. CF012]